MAFRRKGWRFRAGPVVPPGASARARLQVVRCSGVAIRWPHTLLDVELSDREWDDAYAAIDRVFRDPRRVERAYWARACADRAVYNTRRHPRSRPGAALLGHVAGDHGDHSLHVSARRCGVVSVGPRLSRLGLAQRPGMGGAHELVPRRCHRWARWLDDPSEADPEQLAAFRGEVGDLRRPS